MSGFTVYYTDGGYTEFPNGGEQADTVVNWFISAEDGDVIRLRHTDGIVCAQKRNISRIAVAR